VPKDKRTKMEPSGKKGIFVGYNETPKAYKIYVPGEKHIEVSRDISFHEEVAFKRSKELHLIQRWRSLKLLRYKFQSHPVQICKGRSSMSH
jgi:hypothetical protein